MLYLGKNIQESFRDELVPVSLSDLYKKITEPGEEFLSLFKKLMDVKRIDKKAYSHIKTRLPYFIGARFKNQHRKSEYLEKITYFVLDIDHIDANEISLENLRERFQLDQRIFLFFVSPSQEGMKLLFKLSENELTPSGYSTFYKSFARDFARDYSLEKYLDFTTHDVSRVCFLSYDPNACINENATELNPQEYVSSYDLWNQLKENETQEKKKEENEQSEKEKLDQDTYIQILRTLNPGTPKRQKNIFVPEVLNTIVEPIKKGLAQYHIEITEEIDINYGKKMRIRHEENKAEVNIFYGKKGFTVVNCPVHGYHLTLSELVINIIERILFETKRNDSENPADIRKGNTNIISKGINWN